MNPANATLDPVVATPAPTVAEPSDADILRAAQAADKAADHDTQEPTAGQPEQKPEGKSAQPDEPAAQGKKPDEPAKDPNAKPEPTKPEEKPAQTDFAKKQAELARRDKSWRALDEEKQKFRAEEGALRGELENLKRELAQLKQRPAQNAGPAKDEHGNTADDYRALARRYRTEGRDDLAEAAFDRAEKLAKQPAAPEAPQHPPGSLEAFNAPEFQQEWQKHVQAVIQSDPELAKPDNPVVLATNRLLTDPTFGRFFRTHPDGIRAAVEVAKLAREAQQGQQAQNELKTAREELKRLTAEKARLDGLLQPRSGQPTGPVPAARSGAEVSDADMLAAAAAADRGEL